MNKTSFPCLQYLQYMIHLYFQTRLYNLQYHKLHKDHLNIQLVFSMGQLDVYHKLNRILIPISVCRHLLSLLKSVVVVANANVAKKYLTAHLTWKFRTLLYDKKKIKLWYGSTDSYQSLSTSLVLLGFSFHLFLCIFDFVFSFLLENY